MASGAGQLDVARGGSEGLGWAKPSLAGVALVQLETPSPPSPR